MPRRTVVGLSLLVLAVILLLLPATRSSDPEPSPLPGEPPAVPATTAAEPLPPAPESKPIPSALLDAVPTCYRVLDPEGRPVKGARLWADSEGGASETLLGETGAEGTLPIAPSKGPRLAVRAAGLVAWRGDPASLPVEEGARVVRLERGAILRGHLADREGRPLPVAGTVALWSEADQRTVSNRQYLRLQVEGALVATVETDATGQFTFEGADPDLAYHLVGGAKGFIFAGPPDGVVVRTSDPETALPLEPLYGMVARLRDSDGGPMEINWENPSGATFNAVNGDREGYAVVYSGGVAGRLGCRDLPTMGPAENGDYIVAWLFRRVPGPHGPMRFHFKAPAYELFTLEVAPAPVADGLHENLVTMARTAPRTVKGSIRIRFDTSPLGTEVRAALAERSTLLPTVPRLHLFPEPPGGGGKQRTKPVPFPLPPEFVVDDVEPGSYRLKFYSSGPSVPLGVRPERVAVEADRETPCTVTIKAAQCLALDVTDSDGRPYEGALRVSMVSGPEFQTPHGPGRNATDGVLMERPFVLLFVDEGPAELRVSAKGFREAVASPTVVPGSVTRCAIRLEKQ